MPSDKAIQLVETIDRNFTGTEKANRNMAARLIDAHTAEAVAEYKCVLDLAEEALQDNQDLFDAYKIMGLMQGLDNNITENAIAAIANLRTKRTSAYLNQMK